MAKDQWWQKCNKLAEKYSEQDVINILQETFQYLQDNEDVKLLTEIQLYMLKEHSVPVTTCKSWIRSIHNNNISVVSLWDSIQLELETRMVNTKSIRPNIQGMVLQNKHDYRERKDIDANVQFKKMGKIVIDGEEQNPKIG